MRAINTSGTGEWSETSSAVINPALPSAPRRFSGDAQSTGVVLDWLAPADAGTGGAVTGYNIWRRHNGVWTEIVADTGNADTDYTDTASLTVGDTYSYALRAINASGEGEWASNVGVVINPGVPSQPRRLVLAETDDGVVLSWLAPADNGLGGAITGYNIWRWNALNDWTEIVDDTGNTDTTYTDTATLREEWYWWIIRARNASGLGEWSETSGVTKATNVPSQPQSLTAIMVSNGVQLMWYAPSSDGGSAITGYRIERGNGLTWTTLVVEATTFTRAHTSVSVSGSGGVPTSYQVETRQGTSGSWTSRGTQTSPYTLDGLNADTLYQARVRATTSAGSSAYSSPDSTTTDEDTTSTAIIYTDTTVVIAGDGQYFYRVAAINANGQGDYSAVASTQVEGVEPGTPDAPTVVGTGANSIRASWRPGSGGAPVVYDLRVREDGSTGLWTLYFGVSSPYRIIGLIENTSYDVEVRAINSEGITDWSATGTGSTGTASVRIRDDNVLSGGGGIHVTERPWSLYVGIRTRNGKQPSMNGISAQPSSYSWSAYGGPQSATIQLSGENSALVSVLDWNGHNVIISDNGGPVWWGYVDKVTLSDGAWIIDSSIERQYNALRTHKQPFSTSPPSEWTEDAAQIDRYGRRELSLQLNDDIDQPTDEDMRELLEPYAGAHRGIEHSRVWSVGSHSALFRTRG